MYCGYYTLIIWRQRFIQYWQSFHNFQSVALVYFNVRNLAHVMNLPSF